MARRTALPQEDFEELYTYSNDPKVRLKILTLLQLKEGKTIPYSPELNPMEQVWQYLRQHHLANRCFEGYNAILDACCSAWNDFTKDISNVIRLCTRKWANAE